MTKPGCSSACIDLVLVWRGARACVGCRNPIVTEVDDIKMYYPAEPYHQQYLSKGGRFGRPQDSSKGCSDPIRCYG